jgi:hypothetical protein
LNKFAQGLAKHPQFFIHPGGFVVGHGYLKIALGGACG